MRTALVPGLALLLFALPAMAAETHEIPQKTTWIGNTWGGGQSWMQDYVDDLVVDETGRCFANSGWDEGHNERGEYFYEDGEWNVIVHRADDAPAVSAKKLTVPGAEWTIDKDGKVANGHGQALPGVVKATALGLYRPRNYLMVADSGPGQHVIRFFDVSGSPKLVKSFGQPGGISAGTPGEVTKTKFWGLTGCGSDAEGNLYICINEEGVILRRFAVKDAQKLVFDEINVAECYGLHFMDSAALDPASDGREIWGKQEHYVMDYSKRAGEQWTLVDYTVDKDKHPDDPRLKNQVCMKVRYKDGKRFLYSFEQNAGCLNIYRFEGRIAVHALSIRDVLSVDDNCDAWFLGDGIQVMRCTGVGADGIPVYGEKTKFCDTPLPPFKKVKHLMYDAEHDIMFLAGGTDEHPEQGGCQQGPVICRYINWSTTRDKTWEVVVPWYHNNANVTDRIVPQSWDFAGERLYVSYLIGDGDPWPVGSETPGVIRVYDTRNGAFKGRLLAGPEVSRGSSWIDMANAIDAFERANGEHLILREEAWKNKNIMFRYFPEGENPPTTINRLKLKKVSEGAFFRSSAAVAFDAEVELVSGSVTRMELVADGKVLATDGSAPWQFSATGLPAGREVTVRAVAYDANGGRAFSNRIYLKVSDDSPEALVSSPAAKSVFLATDSVELRASALDRDGSVAKIEFFADDRKVGETADPAATVAWKNPEAGKHQVWAVATDNQGRSGRSDPVEITVRGLRAPGTVAKLAPGVRYRYFEKEYPTLPDFDRLGAMDFGSQANLALDKRTRDELFSYRFDGYLKVDQPGAYTFFVGSDDGSKLFIGGDLVVNSDGNHGMDERTGRTLLQAGYHAFTLDYSQGGGKFGLEVSVEGPGLARTRIPDAMLFHDPASVRSPIPVSEVRISRDKLEMDARHSLLLRASVEPDTTWGRRVVWRSDDPAVATIEPNGYVTTHKAGTADIFAVSSDGSHERRCELTVRPAAVPEPWLLRNIGALDESGSASFKDGIFTVNGAGGDIYGNSDEFAFLSQEVDYNATLTARITSQTNTHEWAKSGLMFRSGNTGSNACVMLGTTPEHGLMFLWRYGEGAWCDTKGLGEHEAFTLPLWLRLEKKGTVFTASRSADGQEWTVIATLEIPSAFDNARAGLVVTSHDNGKVCTTTFDKVRLDGK